MYARLTKVVDVKGQECVSCIYYGTERCRARNGVTHCGNCDVFVAILNQLYEFENIVCSSITDEQMTDISEEGVSNG
jgi:hypothetical protein